MPSLDLLQVPRLDGEIELADDRLPDLIRRGPHRFLWVFLANTIQYHVTILVVAAQNRSDTRSACISLAQDLFL